MAHRKWEETQLQPSMLPGSAVTGCCLISFCFLRDIHSIHSVLEFHLFFKHLSDKFYCPKYAASPTRRTANNFPVLLKINIIVMKPGMGSKGVTESRFLQLLFILELYLELSYFFSQICIVVTVIEVTKVPKFLI